MFVLNTNSASTTSSSSSENPLIFANGLRFFAPLYWKTGEASVTDADFPTSLSRLFQIGSEDVNGVAFPFSKGMASYEYDWFDGVTRASPYYDTSLGSIVLNSATTKTFYRNIVSAYPFKSGTVVGKSIYCCFGWFGSPQSSFSSARFRFSAYLIDQAGTLTLIGTSGYQNLVYTNGGRTPLNFVSSSGAIAGSDSKLMIKIELETTRNLSGSFTAYMQSYHITAGNTSSSGVYIDCSVE